MVEVKIYRVEGYMRLRTGEVRKFRIEARGLSPEHVLEKVYSELGSRHKLSRKHVKIERIREISVDEITSDHIRELSTLDKIVVFE